MTKKTSSASPYTHFFEYDLPIYIIDVTFEDDLVTLFGYLHYFQQTLEDDLYLNSGMRPPVLVSRRIVSPESLSLPSSKVPMSASTEP